jgi:nucleoside-diphosphate kinase
MTCPDLANFPCPNWHWGKTKGGETKNTDLVADDGEMTFSKGSCHGMARPVYTQGKLPNHMRIDDMAIERTLSIIKPDATARSLTGKINAKFEDAGLRIVAQKRIQLTPAQAGKFYEVHASRPFYGELCEFMASAPVVVQVLEGEGAIAKNREVMGATNPADAAPGTIRAEFAQSVGENSVHGSDAPETAAVEIAYFFSGLELVG